MFVNVKRFLFRIRLLSGAVRVQTNPELLRLTDEPWAPTVPLLASEHVDFLTESNIAWRFDTVATSVAHRFKVFGFTCLKLYLSEHFLTFLHKRDAALFITWFPETRVKPHTHRRMRFWES